MVAFSIKLVARLVRAALWTLAVLVLLLVLAWSVLHWGIVPRIDEFRPRLQAMASQALGVPVHIGRIEAQSNGLVPAVAVHDLRVQDASGHDGLLVPRVQAAFTVQSLLRHGFDQLVIEQPVLEVRRTAAGRLLVAGLDLSGDGAGDERVADWVFSQPELLVQSGRVRWVDEQRNAGPVELSAVDVVLRNRALRHQMRVDATPAPEWGDRFTLVGQFRQPLLSLHHPGQWRTWSGQVHANLPRVDAAELPRHMDVQGSLGADLRQGQGALRLWADVQRGQWTRLTLDAALDDVSAHLADAPRAITLSALTGRLSWQRDAQGTTVRTQDLHFVDGDGHAWPGGNLEWTWRDSGGALRGDRFDLATLRRIAAGLPLAPAVHARLAAHPASGLVERIEARWDGPLDAPTQWTANGRITNLAVGARPSPEATPAHAVPGVPGVEGAQLDFEAGAQGGQATVAIRKGALSFPGVFEEPRIPLDELSLRAQWKRQGDALSVQVPELKLANADAEGTFKASWRTREPSAANASRFPGVLDLQGRFARADGTRIHRYLPLSIPADARHYVRDAIRRGSASNVQVRVKGDLTQLPFDRDPRAGEFYIGGPVRGVEYQYVPPRLQPPGQAPWPVLTELSGELIFERAGMQVRGAQARVREAPEWRFTRIEAQVPDLEHTRVAVKAEGAGPLAAALAIVNQSPLASITERGLEHARGSGDARLDLALDLPVENLRSAKVQGAVALAGNDLRLTPEAPLLAQATGTVRFSDTGFVIDNVAAQALGGTVQVQGGSVPAPRAPGTAPVRVTANGTASAEALRTMHDWGPVAALARRAQGSAPYALELAFRGPQPDIQVTSPLTGVAIDLPAPLGKSAAQELPLRYERSALPAPEGQAADRQRVQVGDWLLADYERLGPPERARVQRGLVRLGPAPAGAPEPPAKGVAAQVALDRLDLDAWEGALTALRSPPAPAPGTATQVTTTADSSTDSAIDYLPTSLRLRTGELRFEGRTLHDVVADGTRDGRHWRGRVDARELAGTLEFLEGEGGRPGKVVARLARLSIPPSSSDPAAALLEEPPENIPALDVVVEAFELRGKKLGRLEIEAENRGTPGQPEWRLAKLALRNPQAAFNARGLWTGGKPATRRTSLDFRLDVSDAGELLTRLGMPDALRRGRGTLEGQVGWTGSPMSPHYPSMDGKLHLDMGAGQFLKADPGAAKLLGVLSLQALPRRLTLDFRDVFSSGFSFDFVRGDVEIQRGIARTNNLQMKGVNAAVLMEGTADMARESQDLRVVVVPEIDAGTAALVATAINPVVGIGTFLAQWILKRPLGEATTQEFRVQGRWDDPTVTKVPRRPPASDAPASGKMQGPAAPAAPPAPGSAPASATPTQTETS